MHAKNPFVRQTARLNSSPHEQCDRTSFVPLLTVAAGSSIKTWLPCGNILNFASFRVGSPLYQRVPPVSPCIPTRRSCLVHRHQRPMQAQAPAFGAAVPVFGAPRPPSSTCRSSRYPPTKRPRPALPSSPDERPMFDTAMTAFALEPSLEFSFSAPDASSCYSYSSARSSAPTTKQSAPLVPMIQISRRSGFGAVEELDLFLRGMSMGGASLSSPSANGGASACRRRRVVRGVPYAPVEICGPGEERIVVVHPAFDT
jgi:hypothetical protein